MFIIEGICDWCKQPSLLAKHQYQDGKVYYSCENCYELACMDVRLYDSEENIYNREEDVDQVKNQPRFSAHRTPAPTPAPPLP